MDSVKPVWGVDPQVCTARYEGSRTNIKMPMDGAPIQAPICRAKVIPRAEVDGPGMDFENDGDNPHRSKGQ
jgi:hypothetical protein